MDKAAVAAIKHLMVGTLSDVFHWFQDRKNEASARDVVKEGLAFGHHEQDIEIRADRDLGLQFAHAFQGSEAVSRILVEGLNEPVLGSGGDMLVFVDPLDGSLNFQHSDGGVGGLPYVAIVTVYGKSNNLTYDDVVVVGWVDLRHGDRLVAVRKDHGYKTKFCPGNRTKFSRARTRSDATSVDLARYIAVCEPYYEDRRWMARAFKGEKGWLRSPGSAAFEMGLVARGNTILQASPQQKQHEGPGGRALVLGAGGWAGDFEGNDLGPRPVDFIRRDPFILAANEAVGMDMVRRLQR